ncbi:MAG: hypothetical protein V3T08_02785 [Gemmatimonadota bacterium]
MRFFVPLLAPALLLVGFPAAAQKIHGCVTKKGALRIVGGPLECDSNETRLSWNQQGPTGDKGDAGEPGPQGPPGPAWEVFDVNGTSLGLLVSTGANASGITVYLPSVAGMVSIVLVTSPDPNFDFVSNHVWFSEPLCLGDPFMPPLARGTLAKMGSDRFFVGRVGVAPQTVAVASRLIRDAAGETVCSAATISLDLIPADEFAPEDLGIPLPLEGPLYIGERGG